MSSVPPSDDPAPESTSGATAAEAPTADTDSGVAAQPPRTVTRRAPRRATTPRRSPVTASAAAPPAAAPPAPAVEDDASADLPLEEPESAEETSTTTDPEPHAEVDSAPPRTGLIEVPVPSIVRARERAARAATQPVVLRTEQLTKQYGTVLAAVDVSIEVRAGSFTGIVGPNGAGKTTVLSMVSGLNRPTSGRVSVHEIDVWADGPAAKRVIGTLPDRLRLFDRLTGAQVLYYAGVLHGVEEAAVAQRSAELARAFGLEPALDRPVSDYSAGMQKKIGLACAMVHAPDVLVLDEPFEAIDPVSASNVTEILEQYVAGGGSVIMSSHSLDLIQRVCDHVAVIVDGSVIAQGTVDDVRDGVSLEERFRHLIETADAGKGLEWLHGSPGSV